MDFKEVQYGRGSGVKSEMEILVLEDLESALIRLRKKLAFDQLRKSLRRHQYFLRPAERKRLKHLNAVKSQKKAEVRRQGRREEGRAERLARLGNRAT